MLPKNCGQLLYNAVRETLETMAFAEVIPCSIKVGNEEFVQDDDFIVTSSTTTEGGAVGDGWGDAIPDPIDSWGTVGLDTPDDSATDSWGTVSPDDSWKAPEAPDVPDDNWGKQPAVPLSDDDQESWGKSGILAPPKPDPWNESGTLVSHAAAKPQEADFDNMVAMQTEWCWACMKVNSPDIHSVWLIISKGLANSLAQNMYAGEDFQLDNPLIRDLIAELTNVLGGRLMLLLEELGGKFTLTVPEIGFGMPDVPEHGYETAVCKVVVDGEHPVIVALCFNLNGILSPNIP